MKESSHRPHLEGLGLPEAAVEPLTAYLDLVAAWSPRVNLTGARSPEQRAEILVASVLPALPFLGAGMLLDVGSGNGSPGLVLAALRPGEPATLLEPRAKRWAFLREAARVVGRPDIAVLRARHDGYAGPPAPWVTLRGLALSLDDISGLVGEGGRVLCFGGRPRSAASWVLEAEASLPGSRLAVFRRGSFT